MHKHLRIRPAGFWITSIFLVQFPLYTQVTRTQRNVFVNQAQSNMKMFVLLCLPSRCDGFMSAQIGNSQTTLLLSGGIDGIAFALPTLVYVGGFSLTFAHVR